MTGLSIFVGAFALLAVTCNAAEQMSPYVLDAGLHDIDFSQFHNLTDLAELAARADHPHANMNVLELAAYYEYKVERHTVLTSDGYILELHRITGNKHNPSPKGKPAVLLQHGLLCSSMDWVIAGPERGLGFLLADAGYDVWMGNARGSRYSRKHKSLETTDPKFWEFSWHEIGIYDLPATIDHILKQTGNEKITYVGHSQGSTIFVVMLSEYPEYNDKITAMFSLAPISYCSHMTSPVFKSLARLMPVINVVFKLLGKHEFKPTDNFFKRFASKFCKDGNLSHPICTNVIFLICGYSEEQIDRELLPAILAHVPAGSSTKQFVHFAQLVNSGHFRQYDYGLWGNWGKYHSTKPPAYKFENVKVPVSLHYSVNDWLSDPEDVEKIHSKIPNSIGKFRVPYDKFNHLDFLWAKDVKHLLYDKVLSLMSRYKY